MHLKLQHHFGQVLDRAKVGCFLGSQVNYSVAPRKVHPLWDRGKFTAAAAFFRY
jgi:hypothetical protein